MRLVIRANGFTILATIDYAARAAELGVKITARTTIAFAWMPSWTFAVIERPTIAMEVPFRVLVWQDSEGVWVTRDTAQYIKRYMFRHHEVRLNEGLLREQDAKVEALIDNVTR